MYCSGQENLFFMPKGSASWLFGLGMTLRLGKVEVIGRLNPARLKFGLKAVNFAFWLHSWCDALSHFAYFVLVVSQLDQEFWEPQSCWFIPFAAQVSQLFVTTRDFVALLWFSTNLCALRTRQWRAQTLLSIVSNQIRGLIHLKMRPILEGKKQQKRK